MFVRVLGKNGQTQKVAAYHGIRGIAKKIKKIKKSVKKGWTKRYLFVPLNSAEILPHETLFI